MWHESFAACLSHVCLGVRVCAGSRRIVLFAPAAAVDGRLMYVTVAGTRPETPDDAALGRYALDCFGMMLPGADEGRGL